jgi:outer membrane protein OmpA-like peptidoglycan-associated protein
MAASMLRNHLDVPGALGRALLLCVSLLAACGARPRTELTLRQVVLYQNGIGYFEHTGRPNGQRIDLAFRRHEIGDVLKTLTIVSAEPAAAATVNATVPDAADADLGHPSGKVPGAGGESEPPERQARQDRIDVAIALDRPVGEVTISYAVPMPTWKASYRLVLPAAGEQDALLQGWAVINNTSEQDWRDVKLTLATGAPLSFAIDLHTPEYVARPDVTGQLVQPVIMGAVTAERGLPGDGDGDGTRDADDLCPRDAEDRDSFEDEDGCPDPDNDKDRILDASDQCPGEPETYNGFSDEDGCPDRGRVVVSETNIEILDYIYFRRGSAELRPEQMPIVEAIAATLSGNPDIQVIEIQGHASNDESSVWDLSGQRASAVKRELESRGVSTRLVARPYGATQPIDQRSTEQAHAKNRRAAFLILQRRDEDAPAASESPVTAPRLQSSMRAQVTPRDVAGSVRYEITEPVTIRRGASALVPILNRRAQGEDVYLYRPDDNAPLSAQHPWRAGRLVNDGPLPLQAGPVAMFTGGAFVGEGLIERLHPGETAFVPYALDSGTVVREVNEDTDEPARIVAIARGVATVEDHLVRTTRYEIQTGESVPARMFVRHYASEGFEMLDLPPQTVKTPSGYLVPLPMAPARTSVLEVKERKRVERGLEILDAQDARLTAYMASGNLPEALREALREVVALRQQLADHERETGEISDRLLEISGRAGEVRASLQAIGRDPGAADLRRRLLASLTELTQESEKLGRALSERGAVEITMRTRLQDAVQRLSFDRPK